MNNWHTGEPPKEKKRYLVTVKYNHSIFMTIGLWEINNDGYGRWYAAGVYDLNFEVLAWQELPEPYKEVK